MDAIQAKANWDGAVDALHSICEAAKVDCGPPYRVFISILRTYAYNMEQWIDDMKIDLVKILGDNDSAKICLLSYKTFGFDDSEEFYDHIQEECVRLNLLYSNHYDSMQNPDLNKVTIYKP